MATALRSDAHQFMVNWGMTMHPDPKITRIQMSALIYYTKTTGGEATHTWSVDLNPDGDYSMPLPINDPDDSMLKMLATNFDQVCAMVPTRTLSHLHIHCYTRDGTLVRHSSKGFFS